MAIKNPAAEIEDIERRLESAKRSGLPLDDDELKAFETDLDSVKILGVAAEALRLALAALRSPIFGRATYWRSIRLRLASQTCLTWRAAII